MVALALLASKVNGEINGSADIDIVSLNSLAGARAGQLAFVFARKNIRDAVVSKASALVSNFLVKGFVGTQILVADPRVAHAQISEIFSPQLELGSISSLASVSHTAKLADNISVADFAKIGKNSVIGKNSFIGENVVIGENVSIGEDVIIYPNVYIGANCKIGARTILHVGVKIGADGFGYIPHVGKWKKVYQLGNVEIGADVEIGANSCVDRATFSSTVVADGCKLDDLCHIGHNAYIGENTLICSGSLVAGSVTVGSNCLFAGDVGIKDNVTITDGVTLKAATKVLRNITKSGTYFSVFTFLIPQEKWMNVHKGLAQKLGLK